jgi:hypothetical protein
MRLAVLLFLPLVIAVPLSQAGEHSIKQSQLPRPVQQALPAQTAGAKVLGYSQEEEDGQTYYEVEMLKEGMHKDVLMSQDGSVAEVEQEISLESLPAKVREALMQNARPGTITKVESVSKHGNLLGYEAQVKGSKRREVQVDTSGEVAKF